MWYNLLMSLAPYIQKYFWDINISKAQPKKHPEYYIERILEQGDKRAFLWAKRVFGIKKIKKVAKGARLSPRSKNYWSTIL